VVDVVEEPPNVEQEDPRLKTSSVSALDIVQEGKSRVQARRVGASSELIGVNELVCDYVVLHAFSDRLLEKLAHGFEQRDGPVCYDYAQKDP
jgi:hypothetical protein